MHLPEGTTRHTPASCAVCKRTFTAVYVWELHGDRGDWTRVTEHCCRCQPSLFDEPIRDGGLRVLGEGTT